MQIQWKRRLQMLGIIIGVYLGFRYVVPVVIPFLLGWLLACLAAPAAAKVKKRLHVNRTAVGSVLIVLITAFAALLLWKGFDVGLSQIRFWLSHYDQIQVQCLHLLEQCCQLLEDGTGILKEDSLAFLMSCVSRVKDNLMGGIGTETVGIAAACIKWLFGAVSGGVIAVISGIFILKDMDELKKRIREYSMLQGCRRVLLRLKKTTAMYFKAQILIMTTISVECIFGFWLLGSPYYLLLGIGLGLLDALPLIGTGLFLYPAAVIFFIRGNPLLGGGCVALELLTSFTREFMEPRLIGKKLGVYPVVILAAVYLGLVLYGPAGVLFGPLSFSLMYEIGKEWDVWD